MSWTGHYTKFQDWFSTTSMFFPLYKVPFFSYLMLKKHQDCTDFIRFRSKKNVKQTNSNVLGSVKIPNNLFKNDWIQSKFQNNCTTFLNRTIQRTVLSETVLSMDPLYFAKKKHQLKRHACIVIYWTSHSLWLIIFAQKKRNSGKINHANFLPITFET